VENPSYVSTQLSPVPGHDTGSSERRSEASTAASAVSLGHGTNAREHQHRALHCESTDVSEEHLGSFSGLEEYVKTGSILHAGFFFGSLFILKMEEVPCSETSADFQWTTR
jgi:hypothetical protein